MAAIAHTTGKAKKINIATWNEPAESCTKLKGRGPSAAEAIMLVVAGPLMLPRWERPK